MTPFAQESGMDAILKKAIDFHEHLGPFLVIGVRMGLIGIREMGVEKGNEKLRATVMSRRCVPFSCAIDGIHVATKCTVGNGKLRLKNSPEEIAVSFKILKGRQVTVKLNPTKFEELKKSLPEGICSEEAEKIAHTLASVPEKELFIICKK